MDLILSSGFLAFARHLGVLEALEVKQIRPEAVVGTSSGALVAALWLSGMPLAEMARRLSERSPLGWMSLEPRFWRGAFSTRRARCELLQLLPATFAGLPCPLYVGVSDLDGGHELLFEGPLVDAVVASFAVPKMFAPVVIGDRVFADGGAVDRLGVDAWRRLRPGRRAIVHEVEASLGRRAHPTRGDELWVNTPRSASRPWGMGAFYFEKEQARTLTLALLKDL